MSGATLNLQKRFLVQSTHRTKPPLPNDPISVMRTTHIRELQRGLERAIQEIVRLSDQVPEGWRVVEEIVVWPKNGWWTVTVTAREPDEEED